eukprot:6030294-Pyramimonas_sp.AAC.1
MVSRAAHPPRAVRPHATRGKTLAWYAGSEAGLLDSMNSRARFVPLAAPKLEYARAARSPAMR